jgi:hypothetical protein
MPFSREDLRASVERAGDEYWRALVQHHEDPYPRPTPTPGGICAAEAERLNQLGFGDRSDLVLRESRVLRVGEEVELVHVFEQRPGGAEVRTDPFRNYAPDPA